MARGRAVCGALGHTALFRVPEAHDRAETGPKTGYAFCQDMKFDERQSGHF